MKKIFGYFSKIHPYLAPDPDFRKLKKVYYDDLNRQCGNLLLFASILCIFAWLGLINLDQSLHPELPLIYFRFGLSFISTILFMISFTNLKKHGIIMIYLIDLYLFITTPIFTAMTKSHAPYMAGYAVVVMLPIIMPFPYFLIVIGYVLSIILYFISSLYYGFPEITREMEYNYSVVMTAFAVSACFSFFMNKIRFKSFKKGVQLKDSLDILDESNRNIGKLFEDLSDATIKANNLLEKMAPPEVIEDMKNGRLQAKNFVFTILKKSAHSKEMVSQLQKAFDLEIIEEEKDFLLIKQIKY